MSLSDALIGWALGSVLPFAIGAALCYFDRRA